MTLQAQRFGIVTSIGDAVITIKNLNRAFIGEVIRFKQDDSKLLGMILNIEYDVVKAALIKGSQTQISAGDKVWKSYRPTETKAGFGLIGRIVNPLGVVYNKADFEKNDYILQDLYNVRYFEIEREAPSIIQREPVRTPLLTGINAIDCLLPIGHGQRELIVGDLGTGKTTLALTVIMNQRRRNKTFWRAVEEVVAIYKHMLFIPCVYVAIGGKRSEAARIKRLLEEAKANRFTTFVFTSADDLAALQYLSPYAGTSIGEWYRDLGYRALVVYDELLIHAQSYRQVSLLLRRPPGREAFPGDIFFVHSRLLERSAQMSRRFGGGSLTSLPIVETKAGDISAYIPTNIISITDGQIFLSSKLSNQGIRPAIDLNLSVSRVGSDAQVPAMKFVSRRIKSDIGNYRLYAGIEKMGGEIDPMILEIINRGKRITEYFKQDVYETDSLYKQVVCLYALSSGYLDRVSPDLVRYFFNLLFDVQISRTYMDASSFFLVVFEEKMDILVYSMDFKSIQKDVDTWIKGFISIFETVYKGKVLKYAASL